MHVVRKFFGRTVRATFPIKNGTRGRDRGHIFRYFFQDSLRRIRRKGRERRETGKDKIEVKRLPVEKANLFYR
jgi:hypothetical protein